MPKLVSLIQAGGKVEVEHWGVMLRLSYLVEGKPVAKVMTHRIGDGLLRLGTLVEEWLKTHDKTRAQTP